ncbi:MAG: hypothetical protein Q4G04_06815 [bacterium]|nr:hypothetical protein [bacterium]
MRVIKNYEILIVEENEIIVPVSADSIDDAKKIVNDRIDSEELYLGPENYSRQLLNANSKELDENLNIYMRFSSAAKKLSFLTDNEYQEYSDCYTVRDLAEIFKRHCLNYLENEEIEIESNDIEK